MANQNEPAKLLLPYLQRADELQKHEPLVSYYCRLYAMERGLKIPQGERTKTTNALLMSLIKQLEKDKKSLNLSPEDNLHLEGFALNVFGKADKQDRAGRADLNTAKTFYAASIFFEVLSQFGPIPPDFEQKQKYAVWKAADIRKAIKEGRKPNPGPPGGEDEFSVPSSTPSGTYDLGPSEHTATGSRTETDPSHNVNDEVSPQHFHDLPQPPPQSGFQEYVNHEHHTDISPSHHPHPTTTYHSNELPPDNRSNNAGYSQFHNHQPYHPDTQQPSPQSYPSHEYHPDPQLPSPQNRPPHEYHPDPQQPSPQNYLSHESSLPYPNFQSYRSFAESSLPSVPTHYPSQYQNPDTYFAHQSAPSSTSYSSAPQYSSSGRNSSIPDPIPSPAQKYQYDSSYQPPPDKIAEAHKAARFAVGALAFDDVSVAVDHLKKSLELLTNPSPGQ